MKRLGVLLLGALLLLTACGSEETAQPKEETSKEEKVEEQSKEKKEEKTKTEVKKDVKISDDAINFAKDVIGDYDQVSDSLIEVNGNKITMVIVVGAATNEETAKSLADSFVRALATGVNMYGDVELKAPDKDSLGELWEHFDLQIGVGSGPDNFIAQGAKVSTASKIKW
jgi:uncharacterized Zn finger protein (UPF0148 family)